jgi:hypothetical protein
LSARKEKRGEIMNDAQTKKVREIVEKFDKAPENHEVGGWVEKDFVYVLVKTNRFDWTGRDTRLYAIDRDGTVAVHLNYAPLKFRHNALIMGCKG